MHLADAFIQSDLHCIQVTVFTFYQLLLSLGIEPMILALLAPCSTIWATGNATIIILRFIFAFDIQYSLLVHAGNWTHDPGIASIILYCLSYRNEHQHQLIYNRKHIIIMWAVWVKFECILMDVGGPDSFVLKAEADVVSRSDVNDSTEENTVRSDLVWLLYTLWSETDTVSGPLTLKWNQHQVNRRSSSTFCLSVWRRLKELSSQRKKKLGTLNTTTGSTYTDFQSVKSMFCPLYNPTQHSQICFCCKLLVFRLSLLPEPRSVSN